MINVELSAEDFDAAYRIGEQIATQEQTIRSQTHIKGTGRLAIYGPSIREQSMWGIPTEDLQLLDRVDSLLLDSHTENDAHTTIENKGNAPVGSFGYNRLTGYEPSDESKAYNYDSIGKRKWDLEQTSHYYSGNDRDGKARVIRQRPDAPQAWAPVLSEYIFKDQPRAQDLIDKLAAKQGERKATVTRSENLITAIRLVSEANLPNSLEVVAPERIEAIEEAVEMLGSVFHDEWRANRIQPDGTYEPRPKETGDENWIALHGSNEVDIANTAYTDLPDDWKAENKAAAEVVVGIMIATNGNIDLDDTATKNAVGSIIHNAWLERDNNSWAQGGELDVPFVRLAKQEQQKDIDQIATALELFND
jgi:hypothetical protein